MKRYFALVLLLCAGMVVRAQWSVSANLGFSYSNYSVTKGEESAFDNTLPQGLSVGFSPRVGYAFGKHFSAGVDLGFGFSKYTYTDGFYNPVSEAWEQSQLYTQELYSSAVGLFLRGQIYSWGRLSFHVEFTAGYGLGFGINTTTQYSIDVWGQLVEVVTSRDVHENQLKLQFVPVFHYVLGNCTGETDIFSHLSINLYLNFASLAFVHTTTNVYGEKSELGDGSELYSQTVTNDFDIAVRALHASSVSVGLTYSF